jgi:xylulokinase
MPDQLVAGVDCSTQATKVVIVDVGDGRVVADGHAPHVVSGVDGARETNPEIWWRALRDALRQTGRARDVAAISVAAQQHGLVTLDRPAGRPVRPAILWNDTRGSDAAADLIEDLGGPQVWAREIGVVPVPSMTVASWSHLRRSEPHIAAQVGAVRLPHDFLTERLCGASVTDRGDASGTGWWSAVTDSYATDVLSLPSVDLDPKLLPRVLGPTEPAGLLSSAAANDTGLSAGIWVGAGTGDNMSAALALGPAVGQPVVSLGTSGTVYAVCGHAVCDPTGAIAGFADATGGFLPLACTLNATLVVDRMANWLGLDREAVADGGDVVVLPFLDGERTPNLPHAAGTIAGLRHDTSAAQILRATYEGVIAGLVFALETLEEHLDVPRPDAPIIVVGGGARGAAYQQVLARLSGRALELPRRQELVAYGAAVQAAALLTDVAHREITERWNATDPAVIAPVPRDDAALDRIRRTLAATRDLNIGATKTHA